MKTETSPEERIRHELGKLQERLEKLRQDLKPTGAESASTRLAKAASYLATPADSKRALEAVRSSMYAAAYVLAKRVGRHVDDVGPVLYDELLGELRKNHGSRKPTLEEALTRAQKAAFAKLWTGRI